MLNAESSMLNSHRMRIEHWELSIGQLHWSGLIGKGFQTFSIDFDRNRPLQQIDGNDQAVSVLEHHHKPLRPRKRPVFNTYPLSDSQIRPRLAIRLGFQHGANSVEFRLINRNEGLPYGHDAVYTWYGEDGQTVQWIEPAKDVARKQRKFYLLCAVGPPAAAAVSRKEFFVSFAAKISRDNFLKPRSYVERVPQTTIFGKLHLMTIPQSVKERSLWLG